MARNIAAIAKIDAYLPSTATRELVSTQEVQDFLLDLRLLMVADEVPNVYDGLMQPLTIPAPT